MIKFSDTKKVVDTLEAIGYIIPGVCGRCFGVYPAHLLDDDKIEYPFDLSGHPEPNYPRKVRRVAILNTFKFPMHPLECAVIDMENQELDFTNQQYAAIRQHQERIKKALATSCISE